jgi:hypothetical protein
MSSASLRYDPLPVLYKTKRKCLSTIKNNDVVKIYIREKASIDILLHKKENRVSILKLYPNTILNMHRSESVYMLNNVTIYTRHYLHILYHLILRSWRNCTMDIL